MVKVPSLRPSVSDKGQHLFGASRKVGTPPLL